MQKNLLWFQGKFNTHTHTQRVNDKRIITAKNQEARTNLFISKFIKIGAEKKINILMKK